MPTVLIADDDDAIRSVCREILEEEGYTVCEAADGIEAVTMLRLQDTPLIALIDQRMPRMGGLDVLALLANEPSKASHAFILSTAGVITITDALQPVLAQLQVSLLPKPFEIDTLLQLVAAAAQRLAETS